MKPPTYGHLAFDKEAKIIASSDSLRWQGSGARGTLLHCWWGLTRVLATGQEERNKPESSAAKALLLTSSGAREQESKRENGETPSLLRRIILRLGHVTP